MHKHTLFLFYTLLSTLTVGLAVDHAGDKNQNQFTPKEFVIRYWDRVIKNNLPKPSFILSKASPLSEADTRAFAKDAAANTLSTKLPEFCAAAHLLCFTELNPSFTTYIGDTQAAGSRIIYSPRNYALGVSIKGNRNYAVGVLDKKRVQPDVFFREKMLKEGVVMRMTDIKDKSPQRAFLPRTILTKLPFASSKLKQVFKVFENSTMDKVMTESISECKSAPSKGEIKRCVGSLEDMIDFATSVLGRNVMVRSTESANGSGKNIMVGKVKGVNEGNIIESVTCHQSVFPYLLYYCHSIPNVRLYETDLLDPESKGKINHGVAICHLDTTAWNPNHSAFMALGSGPGQIEVCHWIFENEMIWTTTN